MGKAGKRRPQRLMQAEEETTEAASERMWGTSNDPNKRFLNEVMAPTTTVPEDIIIKKTPTNLSKVMGRGSKWTRDPTKRLHERSSLGDIVCPPVNDAVRDITEKDLSGPSAYDPRRNLNSWVDGIPAYRCQGGSKTTASPLTTPDRRRHRPPGTGPRAIRLV